MLRSFVMAAFLTPAVLMVAWGDTLALYVGSSQKGAQARYFPPPASDSGRHTVAVIDTRLIVPGPGLPTQVQTLTANNNLDVVRHADGRVYLAWRSAPDHFAGPDTIIQVVSSLDERTWRLEKRIAMGTDLREPRLLSLHGSLFLYTTRLGKNRLAFQPHGVLAIEKRSDGSWSELTPIGLPGYVAWRTRVEGGRAYMSAYRGGENIYLFNGKPLHVDLLTSEDGRSWLPADPKRRSVYVGGGSETDFTLGDGGELHAVIRNEAGDQSGWGSLVCRADAGKLADWRCQHDPRKFDSPYMFRFAGDSWLLARRNVTRDGAYQLGWSSRLLGSIRNQLDYVTRAKRCSLWRFDHERNRIAFVLDLPSRGDTCFPAGIAGGKPDEFTVYNYSSPIEGADVAWSVGQRAATRIYRHSLRFSAKPSATAAIDTGDTALQAWLSPSL